MNKKFLSAILFGAMMVTSTGTFVSCKDYDDDIDGLQTQVDANKADCAAGIQALQGQVSALQSALATAQSTADAAKKAAADANDAAVAAAKAAEAAAAQAKADAIAKAIEEVEDLKAWVVGQNYVTNEDLAAALLPVSAKITAIEETLDQITVYITETLEANIQTALKNIMTLQEDLAIQQAVLEEYEALMEELKAGDEELWAELTSTREELQEAVSALNLLLEDATGELWAEIQLVKDELYGAITALGNIHADDKEALMNEINEILKANKITSETLAALIVTQADDKAELQNEIQQILLENAKLSENLSALYTIHGEDKDLLWAELTSSREELQEAITALSNLLDDSNKDQEALWNEIDQLVQQNLTTTETLSTLYTLIQELDAAHAADKKAIEDKIEAAKGELSTLISSEIDALYGTLDEKLGAVSTEIENLNSSINEKITDVTNSIAKLDANLLTLDSLVSKRLTSIALIPTQHINGIPAITINTLMYTPQVFEGVGAHGRDHQWGAYLDHVDAEDATALYISSNNNVAKFHLNPSKGIKSTDILLPSFNCITSTNITRGVSEELAGLDNPIMAVPGQEIDIKDGVLTLKIQKSEAALSEFIGTEGDAHYSNDNKESFYMASLKVPVAEHLWTEAEKEAKANGEIDGVYVNSEYNRIEEIVRIPYLVNAATDFEKPMDGNFASETQGEGDNKIYVHYHDSLCLYKSANEEMVDVKWSYNKPLDLKKLVDVCAIDANWLEGDEAKRTPSHASHVSHEILENYESYGLAFRFALAEAEYLQGARETDEQEFAQIDNSINGMMTSKVYGVGETGDSRAAIGREPIVRVSLVDTNNGNALVAQRYIKVRWTETQVGEQIIPDYNFDEEQYVTCMTMFRQLLSKEMNELIYHEVKLITDGGETTQSISKENFHKIYTKITIESLTKDNVDILNDKELALKASTNPADFDEKTPQEVDGFETILNDKDVVFAFLKDAKSNTSYNLVWAMSPKAVGTLKDLKASEFEITVKYVDPTGVHGSVQQTFKQTIAIPTQSFKYQGTYWKDGIGEGVFNVNPIVYNTNNDQPQLQDPHNYNECKLYDYSHIEADLVNGFIYNNKKPANLDEFIQYIRGCANVKFIFDETRFGNYAHLANYVVDETSTKLFYEEEIAVATKTTSDEQDRGNITVGKGNVIAKYVQNEGVAATINNFMGVDIEINTDDKDYAWEYEETLGSGKNECYSIIRLHELDAKNATNAAKALVGKKVPVNLVVEYNKYNIVAEQEFEVYFMNPLEIDGNINDNFVDAVIDGDFLSVAENFTFTDWNGYTVAKETVATTNEKKAYAHELYDYYAVRNVVFATDDVKTSLTLQGNTYIHKDGVTDGELPAKASLKQMNWVEDTDKSQATVVNEDPTHLAYFNYEGTPVNVEYKLFVDVKVDYKWGTLNRNGLEISVKPAQGTDDVNKGE